MHAVRRHGDRRHRVQRRELEFVEPGKVSCGCLLRATRAIRSAFAKGLGRCGGLAGRQAVNRELPTGLEPTCGLFCSTSLYENVGKSGMPVMTHLAESLDELTLLRDHQGSMVEC